MESLTTLTNLTPTISKEILSWLKEIDTNKTQIFDFPNYSLMSGYPIISQSDNQTLKTLMFDTFLRYNILITKLQAYQKFALTELEFDLIEGDIINNTFSVHIAVNQKPTEFKNCEQRFTIINIEFDRQTQQVLNDLKLSVKNRVEYLKEYITFKIIFAVFKKIDDYGEKQDFIELVQDSFDLYNDMLDLQERFINYKTQTFAIFKKFLLTQEETIEYLEKVIYEFPGRPITRMIGSGTTKTNIYESTLHLLPKYDYYFLREISNEIQVTSLSYTIQYSDFKWIGLNDKEFTLECITPTVIYRLNHKIGRKNSPYSNKETSIRLINNKN